MTYLHWSGKLESTWGGFYLMDFNSSIVKSVYMLWIEVPSDYVIDKLFYCLRWIVNMFYKDENQKWRHLSPFHRLPIKFLSFSLSNNCLMTKKKQLLSTSNKELDLRCRSQLKCIVMNNSKVTGLISFKFKLNHTKNTTFQLKK